MTSHPQPAARPPWVDRRLQNAVTRPFRKVHLDFHNTPAVGEVGAGFDPDEFVAALKAGHVDSIVVFAKDMHGYFYYPGGRGPMHPGLHRDLLGEQIAACRSAGIRVNAYYCVTWDNYLAERHPEWLVFKRDRTTYLPRFDETPHWTALCLSAEDFVKHVLADSREILERYDVDGIWYDMPLPIDGECFCHRCLSAIRAAGGDPLDRVTQRAHKQQLLTDFMASAKDLAESIKPGVEVDQNNQTRLGLGDRAPLMSNIDIEALPTGGWGYQYFPIDVRFSRTFGTPVCGQTGRFVSQWADFGGLKHPRQLCVEVGGIVAQAAQCCVGDQPGPSARLDPAVYATIGAAYERVERVQSFLEGAAAVVEAAIVVDGPLLTDVGAITNSNHAVGSQSILADSVAGTARLLRDARVQFDVVEATAELDNYRLLVLPDGLIVSAALAMRLARFVDDGGAVIAQAETVAEPGADRPWAKSLDLDLQGSSEYTVPFLIPTPRLESRVTPFEYAIYGGTQRWLPGPTVDVLALVGEPAFERSPTHFTSHAQSPVAMTTGFAAAVVADRVGAISFPMGTIYRETGYWVYREVFRAILDEVLPHRLLRSAAPSSAELSVTAQEIEGRPRWMVHIVNTTTDVRWGTHLESFDQDLPLRNVEFVLGLPDGVQSARLADSGTALELVEVRNGVRVVVPEVSVHEIVVLEASPGGQSANAGGAEI